MKKILDYLKRYYQVLYDFNLFKKYFKEPTILAMLFVMPLFFVFTFQTYTGSMITPNKIEKSFDHYYDLISQTTYSEVINFKEEDDTDTDETEVEVVWPVNPEDSLEFVFAGGKVVLDQELILDKTIETVDGNYRLIVDTHNTLGIQHNSNNKYSDETKEKIGLHSTDMVVYVADDFVILSIGDVIYSHSLAELKGTEDSTMSIYHYLKENYVNPMIVLQFSLIMALFLFAMYYLVVYVAIRSITKKNNFTIEKNRMIKVCFYSMQPGLYAYLILTFFMRASKFGLSFVVPIISMLVMAYMATKTMENIKDFVKKEQRRERKQSKKAVK